MRKFAPFLFVLLALSCSKSNEPTRTDLGFNFEHKIVLKVKNVDEFPTMAAALGRVAVSVRRGKECFVLADTKEHGPFDEILKNTPIMSQDGAHLMYGVRKNKSWAMVLDGKKGPSFDFVDTPVFSPDGNHWAYSALRGKEDFLIADGKTYGPFMKVAPPVFSPDSRHIAYYVLTENKWVIFQDHKALNSYDYITSDQQPIFSPDSQRLAYIVYDYKTLRSFVSVDGKAGPWLPRVSDFNFSSDSKHFAYSSHDDTVETLYIDHQRGPSETINYARNFMFGPGGKVAYVVIDKDTLTERVCFNGKYSPSAKRIQQIAMSPDGQHLVYVAERYFPDRGPIDYSVYYDNLVVDGIFDDVKDHSLIFSPNGKHYAFAGEYRGHWQVVVDGNTDKIGELNGLIPDLPVFSPDSLNLAYVVAQAARWHVVINKFESPEYQGRFLSSADAYPLPAHEPRTPVKERREILVNGLLVGYDDPNVKDQEEAQTSGFGLRFTPDNRLHFNAIWTSEDVSSFEIYHFLATPKRKTWFF